jgi:hypothetical protein
MCGLSLFSRTPFFIKEVLRHPVELGALHRHDGGWVTDPKAVAESEQPHDPSAYWLNLDILKVL